MPKQMRQWWICKSFGEAGQMNAHQKEMLGDESYRKQKNHTGSPRTKFTSMNPTPSYYDATDSY